MKQSAGIEPWKELFRVRSYEAAPDGRLSLPSLCNYLQEIAGNHARALGLALGQIGSLTWVLQRLRVATDRRPDWGEDVQVTTWPSGHNGLVANREFLIEDSRGLCARGSSGWLLLDLERRRPVRLPETVTSLNVPQLERPLGTAERIDVQVGEALLQTAVRASDLDMNGHVNNVRYLEWMMDSLDPASYPSAVDLMFKAEAMLGDSLTVCSGLTENTRVMAREDQVLTTAVFQAG
jgi:medium-chain acyl-[acyl-carrier-protein] hydrolase